MESTTLYYRQRSSHKVYQASLEPHGTKYVVNFAFGRRGTTLSTGTKTPVAVDFGAAKAIYDKLINEKKAKGYTPGEDGTPYQHTDKAERTTGIHCQLLNAIDGDQIETLLVNPEWLMQEKMDGRRLILKKEGEEIIGINRLGLEVGVSISLAGDARRWPGDFILDGEAIGNTLHVFDLLRVDHEPMGDAGYGDRYLRLMNLLASFQHSFIKLVPATFAEPEKRARLKQLKLKSAEGVVFKHLQAPYTPGRPSAGGSQLKYKFCETASFIVGSVNAKRSVSLSLLNGKSFVDAGNVTIPPNHRVPRPGAVVEVRYLYAFSPCTSACETTSIRLNAWSASSSTRPNHWKRRLYE